MNVPKWSYLYPYTPGTWIPDGLAGHLAVSNRCIFRLHHHVLSLTGKRYRVSTVGLMPDEFGVTSPEHSQQRWYEFGWDGEIIETAVFKERVTADGHLEMDGPELETDRHHSTISATKAHWHLIWKYAGVT